MLKTELTISNQGSATFRMEGNELNVVKAVADFSNNLMFTKSEGFQYQNTAETAHGTQLVTADRLASAVKFFHEAHPKEAINAIKLVRHLTSWGLKEAKMFVDELHLQWEGE